MINIINNILIFFNKRRWLIIVIALAILGVIAIAVLLQGPLPPKSQKISNTRYSQNITIHDNKIIFIDEHGTVMVHDIANNTTSANTTNTVNNNFQPIMSPDGKLFIFSKDSHVVNHESSIASLESLGNRTSGIVNTFTSNQAFWLNDGEVLYYTYSKAVVEAGSTDFVSGDITLYKLRVGDNSKAVELGNIKIQQILAVTSNRILSTGPNDGEIKLFDISNNSIKEIFNKTDIAIEEINNLKNNYILLKLSNRRELTLLNLNNGEVQQLPGGYRINLIGAEDNILVGLKESSRGLEVYKYNIDKKEEKNIMHYPKDITAPTNIFAYNNQLYANTINGVYKFNIKDKNSDK